jgi:threonine dehydratase
LLKLDAIARAARDIDPVFRATPQFEADALGRRIGARVLLKVETVNPIRSFKGRGTDFYLRTAQPLPRRLVTASAGNFGQGLAYAARARGVALDVYAAESANPLKVARMRELGASVHLAGRDFDDAKAHARDHARRGGTVFVEDGREPAIAEGAGSIAVELLAWPEPIATALIPLGNGALLGGMGTWIRHASPATRIIGVCAAGAPAMRDSLRLGRVVETRQVRTIADGIAVRVPIPEALDYLAPVVDDVVLVSDDAMRRAMALVLAETGLVSEPAGVVGVAALLEHAALRSSGLIATPLCGSNVARQ